MIAKILNKPRITVRLPKISYSAMYLLGAIMGKALKKPPITTETIRWTYNFRYYDSTKARKELGWKPKMSFDELVKEMASEDFKAAERDELIKRHGYKAMDYNE